MDLSQAQLENVAVHLIRSGEGGIELLPSVECINGIDETLRKALHTYFFSPFQQQEFYSFSHPSGDLSLNRLYSIVANVFADGDFLYKGSVEIGSILSSLNILTATGELFVARFSGLVIDNKVVNGMGIYKAEEKQTFLITKQQRACWQPEAVAGIQVNKADRACLIFDYGAEDGYRLCVVENGRHQGAWWKDAFLCVKPWSDSYHQTRQFLDLTRSYLVDQMHEEFKVSKADQIDLMNRSVDYFKNREQFDQGEFESEVLADAGVIESFRKYGKGFWEQNDADPMNQFEISAQAVKRQARIFKSVLKLDKNFHVYIHGNRELIERGFDEVVGKHYYKIYFDQER